MLLSKGDHWFAAPRMVGECEVWATDDGWWIRRPAQRMDAVTPWRPASSQIVRLAREYACVCMVRTAMRNSNG